MSNRGNDVMQTNGAMRINIKDMIEPDTKMFQGRMAIEEGIKWILKGLNIAYGLDTKDPNFVDTPKRVAKAYLEMLKGTNSEGVNDILKQNFPSDYSGMVVEKDIECFSMCPHHLLPVKYKLHFAYIPDGNVLGLSKIPRFIKLLAQAPLLQEDFTQIVVNKFTEYVKPKGCVLYVEGWHMCMGARGIEMPEVSTITTALKGIFEEQPVKNEFFQIINKR